MVVVQLKNKIKKVLDILEGVYHCERDEQKLLETMRHDEPLDGLVLTILSQNTNDKNRDAAFANLKSKWKTWDKAAKVSPDELAEAIRSAGLSATKSERILFILNKIKNDFGEFSLKKLNVYPPCRLAAAFPPLLKGGCPQGRGDFIRDYLLSLPGIGPKTAACVLLFDLGLPAFPVDTHIARVCNRLGLVPPGTNGTAAKRATAPEKISELMEKETPRERYLGAHVNIIEFGRNICKAQKPKCEQCPLREMCTFTGRVKC